MVIGYWLLVVGCWLLVIGCWLFVIPIIKKNATVFLFPPQCSGGARGVEECCTILEKWYYLLLVGYLLLLFVIDCWLVIDSYT
nr:MULTISPECIES: TMEM134 family protein [unclassified Tychonema]